MKGQKAYESAISIKKELRELDGGGLNEEKLRLYDAYLLQIKKAAYLGHIEALYDLGQQYEDVGYLGMPNPMYNPKKAIYWYTKAGKKGHADAYNNLSCFYDGGDGCELDVDKALEMLKRSAELGSYWGTKNYKMILRRITKTGSYFKKADSKAI